MVKYMQVATKLQRGPLRKFIFSTAEVRAGYGFGIDDTDFGEQVSGIFNINNLAEVRFQFKFSSYDASYSFSYKKHKSTPDYTVKMNITCEQLQYSKQLICPAENFTSWVEIGKGRKESSVYHIHSSEGRNSHQLWYGLNILEVTLSVWKVKTITLANLYEADEFCDFHLMTADGTFSLPVHKPCLAVHSDMFKRMLNGEWKETTSGFIKIEGVTSQTLKHLKEYLYLETLPDDGEQLQLLLLLAKCYMVDNLKTECIMKLAENVQPKDLYLLQDFAVTNQIPELLRCIAQVTPDQTVQSAYLMENEKEAGPSEAKKKKTDDENVV